MKQLEVEKIASTRPVPNGTNRSINFDAQGQLVLSWVDDRGRICIEGFGKHPAYAEIEADEIRFPEVQRFRDGRWLVTGSRCADHVKNSRLYSPNFEFLSSFHSGDAVAQTIIDLNDNIWIGYFDENPIGLRRFSGAGNLTYDFNNSSGHDIFDLYAMHLRVNGDVWVYAYDDFYLAKISGDMVEIVLKTCPVEGARAILVDGNHVAFFGSYQGNGVTVHDIQTGVSTLLNLTANGNVIGRTTIATHGDKVAFLWQDDIYFTHLRKLVRAAQK
ncbi:hypothetical protein [Actibacterium lipolyticum]|uniref:Uncharacterized protein n=1 Tax=Actibacterium lipolyticum TaxID=1524263 RepID=A0A238JUW8_9RHOB|nr:hypothetical protein [Actibacterium lipolyticum]SMX34441.1 hypothetical protein COL8621_01311 [Actibacterium lipolyticum]